MKLTRKQAINLSIKKWEWIVENNGDDDGLTEELSELLNFIYDCPLCELYITKDEEGYEQCNKCPLDVVPKNKYTYTKENNVCTDRRFVLLKGCCQEEHVWSKWNNNLNQENAKKVLELLKSLK